MKIKNVYLYLIYAMNNSVGVLVVIKQNFKRCINYGPLDILFTMQINCIQRA